MASEKSHLLFLINSKVEIPGNPGSIAHKNTAYEKSYKIKELLRIFNPY